MISGHVDLARWFAQNTVKRTINQSKQCLSRFSHRSYSNRPVSQFKPRSRSNDKHSERPSNQSRKVLRNDSRNYDRNPKNDSTLNQSESQPDKHSERSFNRSINQSRNDSNINQSGSSSVIPSSTSLPFKHVSSRDDELEDVSPQSLMATLTSIDRLSKRINQTINQSIANSNDPSANRLSTDELRLLRRKRSTIMNSLAVLIDSASHAHRSHAQRYLKPHAPPSQMTEQLRALECVWKSVVEHGHPTPKHFTQLAQAYGREARRTKIRDLYDRWAADKERVREANMNESEKLARQHDQQLRRETLEAQLNNPDEIDNDIVPAKLQLAILDRTERWRTSRLARERENPTPDRDLYPLMKLDTIAYNSLISSYLSSLSPKQLVPDSPVLAFPLSLLPKFKPDAATYTILMNLYCGMNDTKRVMKLFQEWRDKEKEEAIERGGRRLPQEQRQKKREERAYVYSIALRSLANSPDLSDAESMWADLHALEQDRKLELTRPLYHSMLHVYATHNNHEKIREIAVEMRRRDLPMDDDSVCTVIKSLCESGHTSDAIMMHQRISHGTMGAAQASRKTYLSLFSHLSSHSVPVSSLHDLFAAGMEDGSLRSPTSHRLKWTIDMRALPLCLLPLSLTYHLQTMLGAYMQTIRDKGQSAADSLIPERGLLIICGKNRAQQERERALEFDQHARDFDAVLEKEEQKIGKSTSDKHKYQIVVDEFADEQEQASVDAMTDMRIQGSYVQRYLQHLFVQEWPSIVAEFTSEKDQKSHQSINQTATVSIHGLDVPIETQLNSISHASSATLRVSRPGLMFWLQCRSCILGNDASLYPPPPFTRAQALHWAQIQEKSLEALRQQRSMDGMELEQKLLEYKRQERIQLQNSANALNGKFNPMEGRKLNGIPSQQEIDESINQPVYRSMPVKTKHLIKQSMKKQDSSSSSHIRAPVITSYLSNQTLSFLQKQQTLTSQTKSKLQQLKQASQSINQSFDESRPTQRRTNERQTDRTSDKDTKKQRRARY